MESQVTVFSGQSSWEIVPTNGISGFVLIILLLYLFFRHFVFVLMFMDIVIGWLRKFRWFPKEGKRLKAFVHWMIAVGLFIVYLALSSQFGWLNFTPV